MSVSAKSLGNSTLEAPDCNAAGNEAQQTSAPAAESWVDGPCDGSPVQPPGVAAALEAVHAQPGRDGLGRFVAGNAAAMKSGADCERLWAELQPARRAIVEQLKRDLGLADDAPATMLGLLEAYAETRLLRESMFYQMGRFGGPVTTKGRSRAMVSSYWAALDRETKLAQMLGLERKARGATALGPAAILEAQTSNGEQ